MKKICLPKHTWMKVLHDLQVHPTFVENVGNNEYSGSFTDYSTFSERGQTVKALRKWAFYGSMSFHYD